MERAVAIVQDLMAEFADLTGLSPAGGEPQRYLWTDAFAVCNFLELFRRTGLQKYRELALRTVAQVHAVLGRHRPDDPRRGWISALSEEEGRRHPTAGGLRIGKELNERQAEESFDERLEWDRDGQYYHYLTKWMHALNRLSRVTADPHWNRLATEMAKTVHVRFTSLPPAGGRKRICWKMSIDLTRPLVSSMGQHDPLDGLVTYSQLQADAEAGSNGLSVEIADLNEICRGMNWATDDPLGTGGLLADACRMAQLMRGGEFEDGVLLAGVLDSALLGLQAFAARSPFRLPAEYRLAFRELGLAIGLKGVGKLRRMAESNRQLFGSSLDRRIEGLRRYEPFSRRIEEFWLENGNRRTENWLAHRHINLVMLAASLLPEGFLGLE